MKKRLACAVLIGLLLASVAWADAMVAGLDGMSFGVEVDPDGMAKEKGEKGFQETITFADGKLATVEGPKLGFTSAPYTVSRSGEQDWSFSAEQLSSSQGTYVWTGTIHDDEARGKLIWTKRDGSVLTYSFQGHQKK